MDGRRRGLERAMFEGDEVALGALMRERIRAGLCCVCEKPKEEGSGPCCCHPCFVGAIEQGRRESARHCKDCPTDWEHYLLNGLAACHRGEHEVGFTMSNLEGQHGWCYYCGEGFKVNVHGDRSHKAVTRALNEEASKTKRPMKELVKMAKARNRWKGVL